MANVKITELTAATTLDGDDVFPVVDVSGDTTNKVSVTDLLRNVPDGTAAAPSIANTGDQDTGILFPSADTVAISTGGTQRFSVDGSGDVSISGSLTVSGTTTTIESTTLTVDDKNIELGTVATPTDTTADGGGITLKGATDKEIKWVNSTGYWTFNTGIEVGGHLQIDDSNEIRVGTSQDLKIYHDGSNSYIDEAGTGELRIRVADTAGSGFYKYSNNEKLATFQPDGAVTLYYNNVAKLATKSDGVDITGELQCDSLDVDGAGDISGNLTVDSGTLFVDSSNNRVGVGTTSPSELLHCVSTGDSDVAFFERGDASGTARIKIQSGDGSFGTINAPDGGNTLAFFTGTSERLRIDSSGNIKQSVASGSNNGFTVNNGTNDLFAFGTGGFAVNGGTATDGGIRAYNNLVFGTGSSSLERMRIDSSGRLLVGTTTEGDGDADELTLAGSGNSGLTIRSGTSSSGNIFFSDTTSGTGEYDGYIQYRHNDRALRFATTAAERMRIDSSGRVGIGTSTLNTNTVLSVHKGDSSESQMRFTNSTTGEAGNNGFLVGIDSSEGGRLFVQENNYLRFGTNNAERMRIDSSGRLLVGHSSSRSVSAQMVVQIEGTNQATSSLSAVRNSNDAAPPNIVFGKSRGTSTGSNTVVQSGDDLGIIIFHGADGTDMNSLAADIKCEVDGTPGSNDMPGRLVFSTTADGASTTTERMRIDSSGNVFIACTAVPSSSVAGILLRGNASGSTYFSAGSTTTAWNQIRFFNGNGQVGTIQTSGSATSYNTSSDYRLKENVVDIADGIDRVKQLQPRRFNFIADADATVDGFLAHEAQTVVPEAVTGTHNEVDDDGNAVMQGIDQSKLVPLLTAALQEAIAKIETLEAKVAALEAQ